MQIIRHQFKHNYFKCAVGKIIIKNFIAHNGIQIGSRAKPINMSRQYNAFRLFGVMPSVFEGWINEY